MKIESDRNRPVICKYKDSSGNQTTRAGRFKVWAYKTNRCPTSNTIVQASKAIVELANGKCVWVNPVNLEFLDSKERRDKAHESEYVKKGPTSYGENQPQIKIAVGPQEVKPTENS